MSNQLSNAILVPFRSASKPYQYLAVAAVIGSLVEVVLDKLYQSNEAFRSGDYVHLSLLGSIVIMIFILKRWSKGLPPEQVITNQRLASYSIVCIMGLPVMINLVLWAWTKLVVML